MQTLLALIPIIAILLSLIVFKLSVTKSGAIAMGLAFVIAVAFFGITRFGLTIASGKALWVGLFVSLIVWNALLLYHLVSDFGAIDVINRALTVLIKDKFAAFLLLSWTFTGLLQGIAGFGIPSVIVAPILIALGFNPVKSVTAALIGHSWAIAYGSMGASFFVIQGITGVPKTELAFPVWIFNTVTIVMTGLGSCFVYDRLKGIKRGILYVLPAAAAMSAAQYVTVQFEMYSLGTVNTALVGIIVIFLLYKMRYRKSELVAHSNPDAAYRDIDPVSLNKHKLTILQSVFPYALILILLLSFQFIPAEIRNNIALAPNFPETATTLEIPHYVKAETDYNPIRLFAHPTLVLLTASGTACVIYKKTGIWNVGTFKGAVRKTIDKGIPATLTLLAFGHMSLIMMDSGMMFRLAETGADITGNFY
ncbi:MAG: L-lactate permease, partial [Oscillospiraceae bacterium]|nr:L-lactate permease [Oscillospiraceae bacterium]